MPTKLTAQEIYDKQFPVKGRGYDAEEVDSFLDDIIEDYQEFEDRGRQLSSALLQSNEQIDDLKKENEALREQASTYETRIADLEAQVARLEEEKAALEAQVNSLKEEQAAKEAKPLTIEERVARLEEAVFGASK